MEVGAMRVSMLPRFEVKSTCWWFTLGWSRGQYLLSRKPDIEAHRLRFDLRAAQTVIGLTTHHPSSFEVSFEEFAFQLVKYFFHG
jgi:hypothetical protein